MITQERLKELLHYDPETGIFTWLQVNSNVVSVGSRAGGKTTDGYRNIGVDGSRYGEHVLAFIYMEGREPLGQIDHKDTIKDNNIYSNLREALRGHNHCNSKRRTDNSSGIKGLSWNSRVKRWEAYVTIDGTRTTKKFQKFEKDLAISWLVATRKRLHGEFANDG